MKNISNILLIFVIFLASFIFLSTAKIAEFDEYWKQKAANAMVNSQMAYHPDPEGVSDSLTKSVESSLEQSNVTRRNLLRNKKWRGACEATNPIDRCWRCRKDWNRDRKRLARCPKGFGWRTTGGAAGKIYVVTNPSDNDLVNPRRGTLRYAVTRNRPLWIIFAHDMTIFLKQELMINSHKTIDGRGSMIHIAGGAGLTIQYVKNVIVHNIHIHDIKSRNGGMIRDSEKHWGLRTTSDGDAVSIYGSSNIWVDRLSLSNCIDGLVDVIEGSTAVTISNCHFSHHDYVMLLGGNDTHGIDKIMQVTVAFNHFGKGLVQRMPRARWGFVHVVNNDYTHWQMYAIGGSAHPTILSQGNRFIAPPDQAKKEVTKRDYAPKSVWKKWNWRSEGDLFQNGAFFVQSGSRTKRRFQRNDLIKYKPASYVKRLTRFAGPVHCVPNKPC